jgi:hypothetical protein
MGQPPRSPDPAQSGLAHTGEGNRPVDGDAAVGVHALEPGEHPGPEFSGQFGTERFDVPRKPRDMHQSQ